MPLYEYECDSCGHRFERIQKFSDPPLTECPKCGQPVRKLMSSPAIQFKGSGWYITDYAKSGKPEKSQTPGTTKADAAAKSSDGDSASKSSDSSKSADQTPSSSTSTETAPTAKKTDSSEK